MPVEGPSYRAFCKRVVGEMEARSNRQANAKSREVDAGTARSLTTRFRNHVHVNELGGLFRRTDDPVNVGRALRIPEFIPVFPSSPLKCIVWILARWMSEGDKVLVAARMLSRVGTSEGRSHVYSALAYLLCGDYGRHSYWSDQLDFLLAEFQGYDSSTQLHALAALPLPLLLAGKRLGISCPAKLLEELRPLQEGINPQAVYILAEEGLLTTGFAAVRKYVKEDSFRNYGDGLQEAELRETVRILTRNGVSPEILLGILHQTWQLSPSRLLLTIQLLAKYGIPDLNTMYAQLGEQLWTLNLDVLRFLLVDVGIRDEAVLAKLGQILRERRPPALPVINTILKHAGHPAALTQVQTLLIGSSSGTALPIQRLDRLLSEPYRLTLQDLNRCTPYLTSDVQSDDKFLAFLDVLRRHGFGHSRGALLFQKCFVAARSADLVDKLIGLTRNHLPKIGDEPLAGFVEQALPLLSTSILYLLGESKVTIKDARELDKVIRLGSVSTDVLRYLVTERRLHTVALLSRWFYDEGEGVQAYSGMGAYGDLERELFADCSRRKAFFRLQQNAQAAVDAMWGYAGARLPELPLQSSQEDRSNWSSLHEKHRNDAAKLAVPFVRRILERTDGIILAGALEAALMGHDLDETLRALESMLSDLLIGRGPVGANISPMEAETIGLVYGVTRHQVEAQWGKITGCQHHLESVQLDDRYPMTWFKKRYSLPDFDGSQLQALASNFAALSRAASRTRELKTQSSVANLVGQFRTKPLKNDAAAPPELADWLGLILAISVGEPTVSSWVDTTLESYADFLDRPQEAHKRTLALQTFISTTLPDEFQGRVSKFVTDLNDQEIASILVPLGFLVSSQQNESQRKLLLDALRAMSDKVFGVFTKWFATLQQKFESEKKHLPDTLRVSGVVTKYPAAFFCRYKFGLCTRENTEMWREERHSHLVVFDDASKTLVGMAMIYMQPIPGHFGGKQCLVIRAINLRSPDAIQVDARSAIDEIMRVAIHIARQNEYAAVLFPKSSTYFSNQPFVDNALSDACSTTKAKAISLSRSAFDPSRAARGIFWCKEQGSSDGAVSELFTVWTSAGENGECMRRVAAEVVAHRHDVGLAPN